MPRASQKLLAILLSLMLGLALLQDAFAAFAVTAGQQGTAVSEMAAMADCQDHTDAAQQNRQVPCPDCVSQHGSSQGAHCSSGGHCAGCLSAVLPDILVPVAVYAAGSHMQTADVAVSSRSISPLFRPPRG